MRRIVTAMFSFGLLIGVVASASGSPDADSIYDETFVFFPFVPAATDGSNGSYEDGIRIQNLDSEDVANVQIQVGVGDGDTSFEPGPNVQIQPNGSTLIDVGDLDLPEPGASVQIQSLQNGSSPPEISAVLKSRSTVTVETTPDDGTVSTLQDGEDRRGPPDREVPGRGPSGDGPPTDGPTLPDTANPSAGANVPGADDDDDDAVDPEDPIEEERTVVDGYNALTGQQMVGVAHYLPIVQHGDDWSTELHIANFQPGTTAASPVSIVFYEQDGTPIVTETFIFRPGEVESVDVSDFTDPGFTGLAFIESSVEIGAVATRTSGDETQSITSVSRPESVDNALGSQFVPLIGGDSNAESHIALVNHRGIVGSAFVIFIDENGTVLSDDEAHVELGFRGMDTVEAPEDAVAARVNLMEGIHVSVDVVDPTGAGNSFSYEADTPAAAQGESLAVPNVQRGFDGGTSGETSMLRLFNPTQETVSAELTFYGVNGNPVAPTLDEPLAISLAPDSTYTVNPMEFPDIPEGFSATAMIEVVDGDGALAGAMTTTTFGVAGDTSVGYFMPHVLEPAVPSTVSIDPPDMTLEVGQEHEFEVEVLDQFNDPLEGATVSADVTAGPHIGAFLGSYETDENGTVSFSYTGDGEGTDVIEVTIGGFSYVAIVTWVSPDE